MGRQVLVTLVLVLSVAARVGAEEPRPSDVQACDEEVLTARSTSAAAAERSVDDATAPTGVGDRTRESAAASPTMKPGDAPATAQERQVFAACLARHGYYKGYYH